MSSSEEDAESVPVMFTRSDAAKALSGLKFARKAWLAWEETGEDGVRHSTPYDDAIAAVETAMRAKGML